MGSDASHNKREMSSEDPQKLRIQPATLLGRKSRTQTHKCGSEDHILHANAVFFVLRRNSQCTANALVETLRLGTAADITAGCMDKLLAHLVNHEVANLNILHMVSRAVTQLIGILDDQLV